MSSTLQNLMCPKSDAEVAEVMFRTNPRKYWRQYVNALEDEIAALEKQLAEKDAMIDWLVFRLQSYCNNPLIINCSECRKNDCHNNNWRKAAQEAVKKK